MKQELWHDFSRLPRLRDVAARVIPHTLSVPHTDTIQKLAM